MTTITCDAVHTGEPASGEISAIVDARHGDPFAVLGLHSHGGTHAVRAFLPAAQAVTVLARDTGLTLGELHLVHPAGFWSGTIADPVPYYLHIVEADRVFETEDPYSFAPLLGDIDIYLLGEGRHRDFANAMGAHVTTIDGIIGVRFAVWAPNARRVSVVGEFNAWDGRRHPMRLRFGAGVWELFIPRLGAGTIYKYEIVSAWGETLPLKADPVAWAAEVPPATASIVASPDLPDWHDAAYMAGRAARQTAAAPISIYEMHATSWMPSAELGGYGWAGLADRLVPYIKQLGFTHIELLPVMEHPFGGSWGYQPLGQFAPNSRLGPPQDFAAFVDRCHQADIGVILDWVPAHFPTDAHGLARFDGSPLYEHADPREGFHRDWNTFIYNHGRNEVRAFLIGSALFWLEHYHVDGLRVDAVASMLYRDYSRPAGEWVPNIHGGRENLEAIHFFHELSRAVTDRVPGAILIAEESTAFPSVSRPVDEGGLGFDFKWNMGWMHDSLHYMEEQPVYRQWHHGMLTFGLVYAFSENFVLPLSHDEVVYGKGSLIQKMPGDTWQRFANLRAYFGFMWSHPGKKLIFMGCEFAQDREWNHDAGLDWFLLDQPLHRGMQSLVRDLNMAYRGNTALHALDSSPDGFQWVVMDDSGQSVFAYLRFGPDGAAPILAVCNFTPVPRFDYRLGVPVGGVWQEIVNTDATAYGGSGMGNGGQVTASDIPAHGHPASVSLTLPPLATMILCAG
jgi:1,4-alpha-glucan branching enzyme